MADTTPIQEKEDIKEFYKLMFPEHSIEELGKVLKDQNDLLGRDAFTREISTVGTYVELIKRMLDTHTDQAAFIRKSLDKLTSTSMLGDAYEYVADPNIVDDTSFTVKNRTLQLDSSMLKGAEVSGQEARMLILAANRNIKKLFLYNSGFHIVIKGPSLIEINLCYNRLEDEMGTYGKTLGSLFFMYSDFKIKEILWEFIRPLIVGSNLTDWDKDNNLRENISLHDYQYILLNIGVLMFKSGYEFVHVCTNPECQTKQQVTIDLSTLQLTDFSRIPKNQLLNLSKGIPTTVESIQTYKQDLGLFSVVDIGTYRLHTHVPSLGAYMESGSIFNDEMMLSIQDIKDPKIIDQYLRYNYNKIFEPWVKYVEVVDDQGKVSFKTSDREAISLILTEIQNSEHREAFVEKLEEFIYTSTITHIGYLATPCDQCKQVPTDVNRHGYVPFDSQNSFFTMLVMRLIQTS